MIEKLAGSAVNTDLKCEFGTGVESGTYSYGEVRVCFTTRNVEMVEYGRVVLPAEVFFFSGSSKSIAEFSKQLYAQ